MRSNRTWIGLASGVALGLAITAAVGVSTQTAGAQANFTVSPEQLKINQNISSAAVKRSNRSLNYLAPIRTTQTDKADDGSDGVMPLSTLPGSGEGWVVRQLARGQKQYWANVNPTTGDVIASSGPSSGPAAFIGSRSGVGNYVVDFRTPNVSVCSWAASPYFPAPPGQPYFATTTGVAGQSSMVRVLVFQPQAAALPVPVDSNVTVRVLC
jgi:hypothetical protein